MHVKSRKIGFLGLFGQQNWGNECTLQAMLHNARKHLPDEEFYCICSDPQDTSARYGIAAVPMKAVLGKVWRGRNNPLIRVLRSLFYRMPIEVFHWVSAFRVLKGTQMLIAPGTGLLTHFDWGVFGRPYDIFKWSIIAKLCRCKLLFVSVGAGPIRHPVGRWFIKSALWMADYRSYRNIKSRRYLEGIGFKTDGDPIYPDLAFSLPVDMMPDGRHHDRTRRTVGVGVMDYDYYGQNNKREEGETIYRDYIQETSNFVAWLLDNQYTVRLLMGDTLCDSCAKEDLNEALKKRGYDDENGRILDEPISSVEQLLSQLAETDIVVSPRFHNILLALMLGKPVVALSYHDKIDSLIGEMELTAYGQHLDQLDSNRVIEQVLELEKNAKDLMPSIQLKTEKYRRSLDEQYSCIFNT